MLIINKLCHDEPCIGLAKVGDKRGKHQERKKKEQELECCKEKLDDKRMKVSISLSLNYYGGNYLIRILC